MRELYQFFLGLVYAGVVLTITPEKGIAQTFTPRYFTTGANSDGYEEYLPAGYSATGGQKFPLIIFLHGVGELGNGTTQLSNILDTGLPNYLYESVIDPAHHPFPSSFTVNGKTYGFVVLMPQFKTFPGTLDVDAMINFADTTYNIDPNRIYLTGLSLGGGVVWEYAGAGSIYANRLAAILPISGADNLDAASAQIIASSDLPVFATHNTNDPTVCSCETIQNVALVNSSNPAPNPPAIDSIFPVSGHDAWTETYNPGFTRNGLNVYQWMLQYARGAAPPVPLPVTLTEYQAILSAPTQVTVSWTTAIQQNNNYFILQRSADGKQFYSLDSIPGNDQTGSHSYSYIDKAPLSGDNFYRLTQVDIDGKTTFYSVLKVSTKVSEATSSLQVSPNPAGNTTYLQLTDPHAETLNVSLSDAQGKTLRVWTFQKQGGSWIQPVDLSNLPAGNYFIRATGNTIHAVQQLVKL